MGTSLLKIELKSLCPGKEKASHDLSSHFKEKEKGGEGRSPLGGQWKEKEKVPMLRAQWNVPSFVANGR